jgi:hypothetical protein
MGWRSLSTLRMPSFVSNECNKDIVVRTKTSGHESEHRFVEFLKR